VAISESLYPDWNNKPGVNVTEFTESWTLQMGFPVIDVNVINGEIKVKQRRFKLDAEKEDLDKYKNSPYGFVIIKQCIWFMIIYSFKWFIPLWYTANGKEHFTWLIPKDADKGEFKLCNICNKRNTQK
jgi:hypothetical protein